MNKHILLVMKWLADKNSVTIEELEENRRDAWDAWDADAAVAWAYTYAAYTAAYAATEAAWDAAAWVDKYFEITGEDKSEYF